MSNVSIYGKNWIDLVFEGKNKSYGAYQLRQQNEKTTLAAFLYGMLLLACVSGIFMLLSSFGEKPVTPIVDESDPIIVTRLVYPPTNPAKPLVIPVKKQTESKIETKVVRDPTIVKANQNPDNVATNAEIKANPTEGNIDSTSGTSTNGATSNGTNSVTPTAVTTPAIADNAPVGTNVLDKLPEFPGGIKKFYEFVGRNFASPDIELSQKTSVLMYFVIEKDGTMTDIQVLRNPGYGLEKEAIRVLKSLRIKWAPGIKDGKPVRTAYTLPIAIQPQQ